MTTASNLRESGEVQAELFSLIWDFEVFQLQISSLVLPDLSAFFSEDVEDYPTTHYCCQEKFFLIPNTPNIWQVPACWVGLLEN